MYRASITDGLSWTIVRHFPTKKEAQWYADNEIEAARELFTDKRADISSTVKHVD